MSDNQAQVDAKLAAQEVCNSELEHSDYVNAYLDGFRAYEKSQNLRQFWRPISECKIRGRYYALYRSANGNLRHTLVFIDPKIQAHFRFHGGKVEYFHELIPAPEAER